MFARRFGHHNKDYKDDQRSPIFIQFLDLVRMIVVQMPAMFEFNVKMLTFIAYEIQTCKYGTFLLNNQRERLSYNLKEKTVSMWTYINHFSSEFKNPYYIHKTGEPYHRIPRIPTDKYFDLTVWKDYYLRYSLDNQKYNPRLPDQQPGPAPAEEFMDHLMRRQRDLNVNLTELLAKSQQLIAKLKQSENSIATKFNMMSAVKAENDFEIVSGEEQ